MADFTALNTKLDALAGAVAAVEAKVTQLKQPPVEDPAVQAGVDAAAVKVDAATAALVTAAS